MQIIVLGMHRSGTSTLARIINLMGAYFGSEEVSVGVSEDNPKGFWERKDVIEIDEHILKAAGGSWWDVEPLDLAAIQAPDLEYIRQRIRDTLLKLDAHRPWFIKEPRLSLTLPLWLEYLESPLFVSVNRSPVQIAKSLCKRNGIPLEYGLALWEFYAQSAQRMLVGRPCVSVSYEDLLLDPHGQSVALYERLQVAGVSGLRPPKREEIEAFVSPALCHFQDGAELSLMTQSQQQLYASIATARSALSKLHEGADLTCRRILRVGRQQAWVQRLKNPEEPETVAERLERQGRELGTLKAELGTLKAMSDELKSKLDRFVRSRSIRAIVGLYRAFGLGGYGLSALVEGALPRTAAPTANEEKQDGRLRMALRFASLAVNSPLVTLRLMHPRRIRNAFVFMFTDKGNLQQLYRCYKETYGIQHYDEALLQRARQALSRGDIFVFPVIDWHFRHQRPQHLAIELGKLGYRVFYLSTTPMMGRRSRHYAITEQPAPNVFICRMRTNTQRIDNIYRERMGDGVRDSYLYSLTHLMRDLNIKASCSILDHAYWKPLADVLPDTVIGYDCMDHHVGFHEESNELPEAEAELVRDADFVITSSQYLHDNLGSVRTNTIVRNGCEYAFFSAALSGRYRSDRPVVGYIGAIAKWFDINLVADAARRLPDWRFVLVGSTVGCDIEEAKKMPNIEFVGETPYTRVPYYLSGFDVCMIPFQITELTKATNPVKVYEYLSAGKPVVSTPMPEVVRLGDRVFIADGGEAFVDQLQAAYAVRNDRERQRDWREWAAGQDWSIRATQLIGVINKATPLVSIVVLTYNNLALTRECLESIEQNTYYPNCEVIIVDNASIDGSSDYLRQFVEGKPSWKAIFNEKNVGFAAGNNVGIRAAAGEYIVLLNNDTKVTPGWLKNLIRPFRAHDRIGLTGPVTNNIGNEARIDIKYADKDEMVERARRYMAKNSRKLLYVHNVAFFCVAISRCVVEQVGLLDERFGLGFFEDDDYCRRVKEAGYDIVIVEDSFIHHHLSASFDKLGAERKQKIFEENKKLYEAKWGKWAPHEYRR